LMFYPRVSWLVSSHSFLQYNGNITENYPQISITISSLHQEHTSLEVGKSGGFFTRPSWAFYKIP
jgi:hypothetical protein